MVLKRFANRKPAPNNGGDNSNDINDKENECASAQQGQQQQELQQATNDSTATATNNNDNVNSIISNNNNMDWMGFDTAYDGTYDGTDVENFQDKGFTAGMDDLDAGFAQDNTNNNDSFSVVGGDGSVMMDVDAGHQDNQSLLLENTVFNTAQANSSAITTSHHLSLKATALPATKDATTSQTRMMPQMSNNNENPKSSITPTTGKGISFTRQYSNAVTQPSNNNNNNTLATALRLPPAQQQQQMQPQQPAQSKTLNQAVRSQNPGSTRKNDITKTNSGSLNRKLPPKISNNDRIIPQPRAPQSNRSHATTPLINQTMSIIPKGKRKTTMQDNSHINQNVPTQLLHRGLTAGSLPEKVIPAPSSKKSVTNNSNSNEASMVLPPPAVTPGSKDKNNNNGSNTNPTVSTYTNNMAAVTPHHTRRPGGGLKSTVPAVTPAVTPGSAHNASSRSSSREQNWSTPGAKVSQRNNDNDSQDVSNLSKTEESNNNEMAHLQTPNDKTLEAATSKESNDYLVAGEMVVDTATSNMTFEEMYASFETTIRDVEDLQNTNTSQLLDMDVLLSTEHSLALQEQAELMDLYEKLSQVVAYNDKIIRHYGNKK